MLNIGTSRWTDIIASIISNYNKRIHKSIGLAPAQVTRENYMKVFNKLYPKNNVRKLCKLQEKDLVRIAIDKDLFEKGYRQTFSDEIYIIKKVISTDTVCYYMVSDLSGKKLFKKYLQELSLVGHDSHTSTN